MFFKKKKEETKQIYTVGELYITDLSKLNTITYDKGLEGYKDIYGLYVNGKEVYFKKNFEENKNTIILKLEEENDVKYFNDILTDTKILLFSDNYKKSRELHSLNIETLSIEKLFHGCHREEYVVSNPKQALNIDCNFLSVNANDIKPINLSSEKEKESLYDYKNSEKLKHRQEKIANLINMQNKELVKIAEMQEKLAELQAELEKKQSEMDDFKQNFQDFVQDVKTKKLKY